MHNTIWQIEIRYHKDGYYLAYKTTKNAITQSASGENWDMFFRYFIMQGLTNGEGCVLCNKF